MSPNNQSHNQDAAGLFSSGISRVRNLFQTRQSSMPDSTTTTISTNTKDEHETYREWGVRWCGNSNASHSALTPALQSCYTHNVNEQNGDRAIQQRNQQNINSQIESKKGQKDGEKINLESKQREKDRLAEQKKDFRDKIDEIKSSDSTNIMAKVNFYIGALITILLAAYLFIFYSSASFSAFFGNNNISGAGSAILDPHCYADALQNGIGQLLFILLMPMIFLGLGFLIHQFGETEKGFAKYVKIGSLFLVTFIFDALLAFEISEKVYNNTVLTDDPFTVSMAFNSPSFWTVIFSGFVAYVIWGMVFDFTLEHFDNMNTHTREIKVLEDKIINVQNQMDVLETLMSQIKLKINNLEAEINQLSLQLQSGTHIDTNILKKALSDFFSGWIAYMNLAAKSDSEKSQASQTYNQFISQII